MTRRAWDLGHRPGKAHDGRSSLTAPPRPKAHGLRPREVHGGFTLVELLIYLGLVGAALTITVSLTTALLQADVRGSARETIDASAGRVLGQIAEAVRAAAAVNTGDSSFGTDAGRLSLTMRDATRSPTVFALANGRLEVTEGTASAVPLTANPVDVQIFRLTYLNTAGAKSGVRVELTLAFRNPGNDPRYQFGQAYVTGVVLR